MEGLRRGGGEGVREGGSERQGVIETKVGEKGGEREEGGMLFEDNL